MNVYETHDGATVAATASRITRGAFRGKVTYVAPSNRENTDISMHCISHGAGVIASAEEKFLSA
jgi:hypothetical protein